jgi:hypothetical protein
MTVLAACESPIFIEASVVEGIVHLDGHAFRSGVYT